MAGAANTDTITDVHVLLRTRPKFLRRPQCEELHYLVAHAASAVTVVKLGALPRKVLKKCMGLLSTDAGPRLLASSGFSLEQRTCFDKIDRCFTLMVDASCHHAALQAFQVSARRSISLAARDSERTN